ncbi:MAG: peptidase U32 family protein, partial [Mobilitalea sp.]
MLNDIKKPELLMPAGNLDTLKTAIMYGADAVYMGGDMYGLRAKAKNFSMEDMKEGIAFAHAHGKRAYITANITAHNQDLEGMRQYFKELKAFGEDRPDALIISDPGVFSIAQEEVPEIEAHI